MMNELPDGSMPGKAEYDAEYEAERNKALMIRLEMLAGQLTRYGLEENLKSQACKNDFIEGMHRGYGEGFSLAGDWLNAILRQYRATEV